MNFTQFLESEDMRALPAEEKNKVLGEITRKLNAGEIDPHVFLPGYTESTDQ